jgi:hypothetical protein
MDSSPVSLAVRYGDRNRDVSAKLSRNLVAASKNQKPAQRGLSTGWWSLHLRALGLALVFGLVELSAGILVLMIPLH